MESAVLLTGASVDLADGTVFGPGRVETLSAGELALLRVLVGRRGKVVHRDELGSAEAGVGQLVRRLRKKVEADPAAPVNLVTVYGSGYRLAPAAPRPASIGYRDAFVGGAPLAIGKALAQRGVAVLTGPPGVGKTRLALRVAEYVHQSWSGGVAFADLSTATAADAACRAVGDALGVPLGPDPVGQIGWALQGRGASLLILDNTEQLADVGVLVARWRRSAPGTAVLVTTRLRGSVDGVEVEVGPLEVELGAALFADRAGVPVDDDVRALVVALGGLPLAIELAAARISIASPRRIRERVERSPTFLRSTSRDGPERHATLHAAFEASWNLLDPDERAVLADTAAFAGWFAADDAAAVSARPDPAPVLDQLVAHHLLRAENGRYRHWEALRGLAVADPAAERRHRERFAALGRREAVTAIWSSDPAAATERIRAARAEVEVALERALADADGANAILAACAIGCLAAYEGAPERFDGLAAQALALPGGRPEDRFDLSLRRASLASFRRPSVAAADALAEVRAAAPTALDAARAGPDQVRVLARCGEIDRARILADQVVAEAEALGVVATIGNARAARGYLWSIAGDLERAEAEQRAAVAALERAGDPYGVATISSALRTTMLAQARYAEAEALEPALEATFRRLGMQRAMLWFRVHLGERLAEVGDAVEAEAVLVDCLGRMRTTGEMQGVPGILVRLGSVRAGRDAFDAGEEAFAEGIARYGDDALHTSRARTMRALARLERGDPRGALTDLDPVEDLLRGTGDLYGPLATAVRAAALARLGQLETALLAEARQAIGAHPTVGPCLDAFAVDLARARGESGEAPLAALAASVARLGVSPTSALGSLLRRRATGP